MYIVGSCLTICVGESIVKFALTHKYVYHLEPLQRDFVLTVFPHIVAAATILFWKFECGNYSREETIQRRKVLFHGNF